MSANPRFIVTGTGRSGTSAVARLLHEAGLSVGHDLIPADAHNAEGYFEERPIIEANQAILNAAGIGPPFTSASRQAVIDAAQAYIGYMVAAVGRATPAWKDPRFCWTLEAWLPLFGEPPKVIVCLRNPAEVAASTMTYFGQVGEEATRAVYHTWRVQYERLLEILGEHRLSAVCVEYDRLHEAADAVAADLSAFAETRLDGALVRADLRHHRRPLPDELRPLYDDVKALGCR